MATSDACGSEKEYEDVDAEAWFWRASAVINRMRVERGALKRADSSPERRAEAIAYINRAWQALAGRTPMTEDRLRLMHAVDDAAAIVNPPEGLGAAVLALLPAELVARLAPHSAQLKDLALAWRVKTPGWKGHAGKWEACAKVWNAATGEKTLADVWERTWKEDRRRKRRELERAKRRVGAEPGADRKREQAPH